MQMIHIRYRRPKCNIIAEKKEYIVTSSVGVIFMREWRKNKKKKLNVASKIYDSSKKRFIHAVSYEK